VLTSKSFETTRQLCAKGYGATILPRDYVHFFSDHQPIELFSISPEYLPYWDLCVAMPSEYSTSGLLQDLIRIIRKEFGEHNATANMESPKIAERISTP